MKAKATPRTSTWRSNRRAALSAMTTTPPSRPSADGAIVRHGNLTAYEKVLPWRSLASMLAGPGLLRAFLVAPYEVLVPGRARTVRGFPTQDAAQAMAGIRKAHLAAAFPLSDIAAFPSRQTVTFGDETVSLDVGVAYKPFASPGSSRGLGGTEPIPMRTTMTQVRTPPTLTLAATPGGLKHQKEETRHATPTYYDRANYAPNCDPFSQGNVLETRDECDDVNDLSGLERWRAFRGESYSSSEDDDDDDGDNTDGDQYSEDSWDNEAAAVGDDGNGFDPFALPLPAYTERDRHSEWARLRAVALRAGAVGGGVKGGGGDEDSCTLARADGVPYEAADALRVVCQRWLWVGPLAALGSRHTVADGAADVFAHTLLFAARSEKENGCGIGGFVGGEADGVAGLSLHGPTALALRRATPLAMACRALETACCGTTRPAARVAALVDGVGVVERALAFESRTAVGADFLLPGVVFLLVTCAPRRLESCLSAINRFCVGKGALHGRDAYVLATVTAALGVVLKTTKERHLV